MGNWHQLLLGFVTEQGDPLVLEQEAPPPRGGVRGDGRRHSIPGDVTASQVTSHPDFRMAQTSPDAKGELDQPPPAPTEHP